MKAFNLKEYLKNPSRKVVTRDGRNVTIHCTNLDGIFPVVAEIEGWGSHFRIMNMAKIVIPKVQYVTSSLLLKNMKDG